MFGGLRGWDMRGRVGAGEMHECALLRGRLVAGQQGQPDVIDGLEYEGPCRAQPCFGLGDGELHHDAFAQGLGSATPLRVGGERCEVVESCAGDAGASKGTLCFSAHRRAVYYHNSRRPRKSYLHPVEHSITDYLFPASPCQALDVFISR